MLGTSFADNDAISTQGLDTPTKGSRDVRLKAYVVRGKERENFPLVEKRPLKSLFP
jgi:hypothetical protein